MPPIRGYTCVLYRRRCYFFGGFSPNQKLLKAMLEYDFGTATVSPLFLMTCVNSCCVESNSWREIVAQGAPIPQRSMCDFQFHGGRLYVFGGVGPRNLGDFYMFSFGTLPLSFSYYQ